MIPVAVVRLIIADQSGRVLLLRRATPGAPATWCLPGGKVDYGETVEAAAARELAEETALRLNRCRFLFFQDSLPFEPGGMHCINFYLACEAAGEVVLNAESAGHAWIGSSDLATYNIVFRNDVGLKRFWEETS